VLDNQNGRRWRLIIAGEISQHSKAMLSRIFMWPFFVGSPDQPNRYFLANRAHGFPPPPTAPNI